MKCQEGGRMSGNKSFERNVSVFNQDAAENRGYGYTTGQQLSSRMATARSADVILEQARFEGRRVLDMGCGDGHFTLQFWDRGRPLEMTAVDAAPESIKLAASRREGRAIRFAVGDVHRLPFADNSFDIALMQSVLHHDDTPEDIVREAFRLASEVIIHEPNGNNPALKIIERVSRYHREHNERSYSTRQLQRWILACGARVVCTRFAGFVPMFSPDWIARLMKRVEPAVESLPLANSLCCAVVVLVGRKNC
ncbi:MAG: class I SAM-dependent methyltransferase [Verrucomicrobiia bacterium]